MRKKLFILMILLLVTIPNTVSLSNCAFGESVDTAWVRRYNGPGNESDEASAIAVDGSDNVYVTGYSAGAGTFPDYFDYATIKYYANGDTAWVRRYNGQGNSYDEAQAIAVDGSGNVYVTGYSYGNGTSADYATIKYYPDGDTAWVRRYNGPGNYDDAAYAIAVDVAANVYVTGSSYGNGTSADYATIKYYPDGDTAWVRRYNGPGIYYDDGAYAIAVDGSGNVYVTGYSYGSGTDYDYATIKYYPDGDTAWVRRYNGPGNVGDGAYAIAVDCSGNVYVTGVSTGSSTFSDYATIKYYPDGDTTWVRRYNGPGNNYDYANALAVDGSGNVYVTGRSAGSGSSFDYATVKYYPNGDTGWVRRYNGPLNSWDEASAIAVDDSINVYVTGGSGNAGSYDDYATIKYYPNGDTAWVRRYNGPGKSTDMAFAIAVDGLGKVYVTGLSDGSGTNYDYATIKYVQTGGPMTLVLKDGSASHNPIANKSFKIYKVTNNPPTMSETYRGELTTDGSGRITLPEGWFEIGDWVKVERLLHTEPAVKHKSILPNMYYIKIDNGKFYTGTGAISYHTLTSDAEQEVIVDHTTVMYDLLVSVEWDADLQYLENLQDGFKLMSNYLYDVTDGQTYLNKVVIYDSKVYWDSADVWIYADNTQGPRAAKESGNIRFGGGIFFAKYVARIYFPRIFYSNFGDANRILTYDLYPYDWTIAQTTYNGLNWIYPPIRGLAHEFGHYGIGFQEEYCDCDNNRVLGDYPFGLMDDPLEAGVAQNSEMSSLLQYDDLSHRVTCQWVDRGGRSCWDYYMWNFQDTYDGIYAPIKKPLTQSFEGPNNELTNLNYDVGNLLIPYVNDYNGNAKTLEVICKSFLLGLPLANAKIILSKQNYPYVIDQGRTADNGRIKCLGVNIGDGIAVNSSGYNEVGRREWSSGKITIWAGSSGKRGDFAGSLSEGDSVTIALKKVSGNYLMINKCLFEDSNNFTYGIELNQSFAQNPGLELYSESGQIYSYTFGSVTGGYEVSIGDSLGWAGIFSVIAVDDSLDSFFVNNNYTVTYLFDSLLRGEIYGPSGACVLNLDTHNTAFQKILILSSDFPPLLNGLDSSIAQGGALLTICAYPNINDLSGDNNYLVIRYSDSDLKNTLESSLEIFKWDETLRTWISMGGIVDTVRNEVVAQIQSLGIYAVFTSASDVRDETGSRERPSTFSLSQNYPNPFNQATKIEFTLAKSSFVTLQIYDLLGRKVRTLVSEQLSSGYKSVLWDGKNDAGKDVASGIYFYQLRVGDFSETKKLVLLR